MIQNWEKWVLWVYFCFRVTWRRWRNGMTRIFWNSEKEGAESCAWGGTTPGTSRGWDLPGNHFAKGTGWPGANNVPLQNWRSKAPWAAWGRVLPAGQGRCSWRAGSCSEPPEEERYGATGGSPAKGLWHETGLRNLGLLIPERRRLSRMLSMCTNTQLWGMREPGSA